ncbi:YacL family protein [Volucribacter amazonae]|uniref:Uncharacterized protein n=1 Tax=Volucribacter amazonae TaxID=256731 RepID=A0A9X4PEV6_9PAST|nr:YacL family protein [Volucribacter amazonae]MDG6894060.1 hypothetical protein [Volucribacter amazonae]MDG6896364.1 hypothetical protein [Volucribacter amazonae]
MDFQFSQYLGQTLVKCSMEHEAFAHWLNTEINANLNLAQQILTQLNPSQCLQVKMIEGKEYSLYIDQQQVICQANSLAFGTETALQLEQDLHYYDSESVASCGLEDFIQLLEAYIAFHTAK